MDSTKRVPISVANATRTATQGGTAWVVMEVIDSSFYDMSDRSFAAWVLLLTLIFSFVQPIIENYFGRAFLRTTSTDVAVSAKPQT